MRLCFVAAGATTKSPNSTNLMSNGTLYNYNGTLYNYTMNIQSYYYQGRVQSVSPGGKSDTALDFNEQKIAECYQRCWKMGYTGARYGPYWKCHCHY